MIHMRYLIFFCILTALPAAAVQNPENTRIFLDGVRDYNQGDYSGAISRFSDLAEKGLKNGKLFYNLGNAYMKKKDVGRAVLWYERALKFLPDDPDLKFNLDYAYSLLKDEKGDYSSPALKILFFWKHQLSPYSILWAAILLNAIVWTVLALRLFFKKIPMMPTLLMLILAGVFILTAAFNYYELVHIKHGIILAKQVSIRSGLDEHSTELFSLHAGTRVRIEGETRGYYKIYYSSGKIGWVSGDDIGII